jgi:UDP-N-acetylmuramate: L-alanyl-gamma-D-glutamyl-meso-diaminopimelate ligase
MLLRSDIKNIYFLAIAGTAMASLAAMFKSMGFHVYGTDKDVYPPMSTFLKDQGIQFFEGFSASHLEPKPDLVIVGNVISRGNPEIEVILEQHLDYISLPDAIREFFIRGHRSIVVTGTHGKTTTTSLLAWIFEHANRDPGFLVGGVPLNFDRGYQVGSGKEFIIEGDEYDSAFFDKVAKFLRYKPDIGIINHVEYDHADIYSSLEEIIIAFQRFVNLIPRNGMLASCADFERVKAISERAFCPVHDFGVDNPDAYWYADNVSYELLGTRFQLMENGKDRGSVYIPLLGKHNVRNALAAIAVARFVNIEFDSIFSALETFKGIRKRMDFKGEKAGVKIFDDFGHHPTAIKETLLGLRNRVGANKIWALFEPRSATTRRNVFQQALVDAFREADAVLLAPVNQPEKAPAGQVLSVKKIASDLCELGKDAWAVNSTEQMIEILIQGLAKGDIVITFSNGPFDNIHEKLLERLL